MKRGWVQINNVYHYALSDKSALCDMHIKHKGLKRDMIERDPADDAFLNSRGNVCSKCRELWSQREMIEMMREDGVSEEALPLGVVDPVRASKDNYIEPCPPVTLNNTKPHKKVLTTSHKRSVKAVTDMIGYRDPDLVPGSQPFEPVKEQDAMRDLQSLASALLDTATDKPTSPLKDYVNQFIIEPRLAGVWYSNEYKEVNFDLGKRHAYDYHHLLTSYGESFCNKLSALASIRELVHSNSLYDADPVELFQIMRVLTDDSCTYSDDIASRLKEYLTIRYIEPYRYPKDYNKVLRLDDIYHTKSLAYLSGMADVYKNNTTSYIRILHEFLSHNS